MYTLSNLHNQFAFHQNQGAVSTSRCRPTSIGIPIWKIRRSRDRLIFNMGIPYPGKTVFILRRGPGLCYPYYLRFLIQTPATRHSLILANKCVRLDTTITKWCIMGCGTGTLWDLWIRSVVHKARTSIYGKSPVPVEYPVTYMENISNEPTSTDNMMTSSNRNIFRLTCLLCGWIHLTKAIDAELWCFLWFAPE